MENLTTKKMERRIVAPTKTQIDMFGKFKPEQEHEVRKFSVRNAVNSETLMKLKDAFIAVNFNVFGSYEQFFKQSLELIRKIKYASADITNFSIALHQFQDGACNKANTLTVNGFYIKSGFFLSALINNSREDKFTLITDHLEDRMDHLGYRNRKHITVKGNVGNLVGQGMEGGRSRSKAISEVMPARRWRMEPSQSRAMQDAMLDIRCPVVRS